MLLAVADQVGAAHGLERLAQQRPVVGIVVAQEGLVQPAAFLAAHDVDGLAVTGDPDAAGCGPLWYIAVAVAMGLG
jgi:hypothetical protein